MLEYMTVTRLFARIKSCILPVSKTRPELTLQRGQSMRGIHFFAHPKRRYIWYFLSLLCTTFFLTTAPASADSPVTLVVPSRHMVNQNDLREQNAASQKPGERPSEKNASKAKAQNSSSEKIAEPQEVDILLSMMRPFLHVGVDVDMPQLFAVLRHDANPAATQGGEMPERSDLLGDVEEIRYLDQRAWGANVALDKPGLYTFILESRPWWDEERSIFLRQQAKTMLPVNGVGRGWNEPAGQSFEIVPLTRPFGLTAPALFSGRILLDGKALADAPVRMVRINANGASTPAAWQEDLAGVSNAAGEFSFLLPQAGWWCCEAIAPGQPLKGPDGELKAVQRAALFWLFVETSPIARDDGGRKR